MYERIVVPLDGSALAERALPPAEELARLSGAPVHLVRVVDLTKLGQRGAVGLYVEATAYQQALEDERIAGREDLERVERAIGERGLTVTTEIRFGAAADELVATARPGDIIVMATHGRGGVTRWFLGSVAEAVVHRATVPVMLIRTPPDASARGADASGTSRARRSAADLLRQETYRPEELADLLGLDVNLVREACFGGQLRADILGHHVVGIRREDALRWLAERE